MKYLKPFNENLNKSGYYQQISDEEYRNKTCHSIGGSEYDSLELKTPELFNKSEIDFLDNVMEHNKNIIRYNYKKYQPKNSKWNIANYPEWMDYYNIELNDNCSYLISKKHDDWFYVLYSIDRNRLHFECDQLEGVIELLRDKKVIK